jgi:hypothetical protein
MKRQLILASLLSLVFSRALGAVDFYSETAAEVPTQGVKFPNTPDEGDQPVMNWAWAPTQQGLTGYTKLVPFISPSPNQEDAGSCLFMSLTGIVEWWMNFRSAPLAISPDGPRDLSERWFMNLYSDKLYRSKVKNWRTDMIFALNAAGKIATNRDYRFAKGWYRNKAGEVVAAEEETPKSRYGTKYNWIDDRDKATEFVKVPTFKREILFADSTSDQWGVGVMPDDIVARVKNVLVNRKVPVHVIYNHYGIWHAVVIVGFDDERSTFGCSMIEKARERFAKSTLRRYKAFSTALEASIEARGACNEKGVFYVRDSIYESTTEPMYVYDVSKPDAARPYSPRLVMLEYSWLTHLANHIVVIEPEDKNN